MNKSKSFNSKGVEQLKVHLQNPNILKAKPTNSVINSNKCRWQVV